MKEKLTLNRVCDDVVEECKRLIKGTAGGAVAFGIMSSMILSIHILGEGPLSVGLMVVMLLLFTVYLCLLIFLYYLRMKKAKNGQLYVVRDIMYRREIVKKRRRRSSVYVKTLFLKNNGKFAIGRGGNDAVYHETECGETVYLVFAGLFPNKILYAYSGGKYEPDFEIRS